MEVHIYHVLQSISAEQHRSTVFLFFSTKTWRKYQQWRRRGTTLTPRLIYSTFRIKPYLVQINEIVVLLLFDRLTSLQNCRLDNYTAIRDHFTKKNKNASQIACPWAHTHTHTLIISSDFLGSLNVLAALFQVNPTHKEVLSAVKVQGHKPNKMIPPLAILASNCCCYQQLCNRKGSCIANGAWSRKININMKTLKYFNAALMNKHSLVPFKSALHSF